MSQWIEEKYIGIIGHSLPFFHKQSKNTYAFRCPFCGDSKKRQNKTRGYLFLHTRKYFFKCHNCNESMSFVGLLKRKFAEYYKQFQLDSIREASPEVSTPIPSNQPNTIESLKLGKRQELSIQSIAELSDKHQAVIYCKGRLLPEESFAHLYFTSQWTEWIRHVGWNYRFQEDNAPRLILPWFSRDGKLQGAQARRIDVTGHEGRYITLKAPNATDDSKIYGVDRLNLHKPIYMVEGPLDSWFLPNCVAAMGSDLLRTKELTFPDRPITLIWDNEPRNTAIAQNLNRAIEANNPVVIWPKSITDKDINDMVKSGIDVADAVTRHTYTGLRAKLEFTQWKQ